MEYMLKSNIIQTLFKNEIDSLLIYQNYENTQFAHRPIKTSVTIRILHVTSMIKPRLFFFRLQFR